jgi:HEAT repeat protein
MRAALAALAFYLVVAAGGSALSLAPAPRDPGPAATPGCPAPSYPDAPALLAALHGAGYDCAEAIAAALRARVGPADVDALLAMAESGSNALIRRNAVRALGRLAEAPRGSRASELVLRVRAAAIQDALAAIVGGERDNFLAQDAVWVLDTFFYPTFTAAPGLERVAADPGLAPALRYRAALARARLVFARPGSLDPADRAFILAGLRSDDPGVRASAASAVARLRDGQLTPALAAELGAALVAAWDAEPPLALAPDVPVDAGGAHLTFVESSPTSLTARAAIARARDRIEGGAGHLDALRAAYEAIALPRTLARDGVVLRSGLPPERLPALLDEAARAREAFFAALGPGFAAPIPGEGDAPLAILVFARQGVYRDYIRAFTPFAVDVDGTYDEAGATLYTHERTPEQSANTLAETLRHELTHHLTGRYLFPGRWLTPGYHAEPKGWLDEGLAELLAGLEPSGIPAPRPAQLAELCARRDPPALAALLARREGYDRFGSFDYPAAWALSYYLVEERPEVLRRVAAAFRDGSYRLAGASIAPLEAEWHAAIRGWCAAR